MFLSKKVCIKLNKTQKLKINVIFKELTLVYNEGINLVKAYYIKYRTFISRDYLVNNYRKYSKLDFLSSLEPLLITYTLYSALDACVEANKKKLKVQYKSLTYKKHQIKIAPSLIMSRERECVTINVFKGEPAFNTFKLKKYGTFPRDCKIYDLKILCDGSSYFLFFALNVKERELVVPKTIGIGIDVGIKNLATLSDGTVYENVANSKRMRKLLKMRREATVRLGELLALSGDRDKELPSNSVIKVKQHLNDLDKKIKDYRKDYLHKVSSEIVKRNPKFIVIEDLDIIDMSIKNRSIAENFLKASVGLFLKFIEYKCNLYKIPLYVASKTFASSKKCSKCGHVKDKLTLRDRTFVCESCGKTIDRDKNAAINLYKYGLWLYRNERLRLGLNLDDYYCKVKVHREAISNLLKK